MKLYFCMVAELPGSDLGEIDWEQVDLEAASSTAAAAASADSARWLARWWILVNSIFEIIKVQRFFEAAGQLLQRYLRSLLTATSRALRNRQ